MYMSKIMSQKWKDLPFGIKCKYIGQAGYVLGGIKICSRKIGQIFLFPFGFLTFLNSITTMLYIEKVRSTYVD